ncbi:caspase domain-containing protein [Amylostereum chailletii]|nr:caspase domain-containing protein [Amylostereum chailletii]
MCSCMWTFFLLPKNREWKPRARQRRPFPNQSLSIFRPAPSIFALVIGIDRYKHAGNGIHNLGGCVADADDMVKFLIETMQVPPTRIQNLRDEQATRGEIKAHIRGLAENSLIQHGDPILIFYAGHGGEAKCPARWEAGDKIQMLLPHDFVPDTSEEEDSQGILDISLSVLLSKLAGAKGDNITVILDCCHSGSATRDHEKDHITGPVPLVRGVCLPADYAILPTVDEDIFSETTPRAWAIAKGYRYAGMASHVLLAACKANQKAHETGKRGQFTLALMDLLRKNRVEELTYEDAIKRLPDLPLQNPQCEGVNKARLLFNGKALTPGRVLYQLKPGDRPNEFLLSGGEAHGVTEDAQFEVYAGPSIHFERWGTLVASRSNASSAVLKPANPHADTLALPASGAWALQTRIGRGEEVRIELPLDEGLMGVFERVVGEMKKAHTEKRRIRLVDAHAQPDLVITVKGESAVFHVQDARCREHGLTTMVAEVPISVDAFFSVLESAADFYWHLRRSARRTGVLASKVTFECTRLAPTDEVEDGTEDFLMVPDGPNLNVDGVIHVVADDLTDYGFKIVNGTDHPLFVSVFYFDFSDLSIDPYYQPIGAAKDNKVDPIPSGGALTIGYGAGGERPVNYFLREGQSVDVGYLKLFLSTDHIDLRELKQDSPFDGWRASHRKPRRPTSIWDTMLVTVVQRNDIPVEHVDRDAL